MSDGFHILKWLCCAHCLKRFGTVQQKGGEIFDDRGKRYCSEACRDIHAVYLLKTSGDLTDREAMLRLQETSKRRIRKELTLGRLHRMLRKVEARRLELSG